jgi:hypothetical protein
MSPDLWIFQVFDHDTFIHTYKNVLGALIQSLIVFDLNSFIHMM